MHKAVILLVKADDRTEAVSKAREFLEPYGGGDIWDWYSIGGRWTNSLVDPEKYKQFQEKVKEITGYKEGDFGISVQQLEKNADKLTEVWQSLGFQGKPAECYDGGFGFSSPEDGAEYDVVPLEQCLEKVKDWHQDHNKAGKEQEEAALLWKKRKKDGGYCGDEMTDEELENSNDMYGYILGRAASLYQQNFSFECNVYNTERSDFSLPENIEGWWAVMIDMHN